MEMLERAEVPEPCIAEEPTTLAPSGKGVVVRALMLDKRLALARRSASATKPLDGEEEEEAQQRAGMEAAAFQLAHQVFLADGTPVYSMKQWLVYAATEQVEFIRLHDIASRLAGIGQEAVAKN